MPDRGSAAPSGPCVRLTVVQGPMAGREYSFAERDTVVVGRSSGCHVSLPDDRFASRHHFLLEIRLPDLCLSDLGSLNGTFVNGVRYGGTRRSSRPSEDPRRPVYLSDGDEVSTGGTVLRVAVLNSTIRSAEPHTGATGHSDAPNRLPVLARVDPQAPPPSVPGYALGPALGWSSYGMVYRAVDRKTGRRSAVRTMHWGRTPPASLLESVRLRLAELCRIRHPNLVSYVAHGLDPDGCWLAMTYCEHGSLADLLADRGVPVSGSVAYGITMQVVDGLAHAHEKGWVHRDVRLSSVLMAERGGDRVARLSDLGLAELFQAPPTSAATPALPLSLWAFVPPERLTHAREEGPPGDVFSAAALFYYLLTGVPPRDTDRGQDPRQSLLENEAVPLNRRDPTLAKSVASVVDRALRSDPQERYEDAGAFRRALERAV